MKQKDKDIIKKQIMEEEDFIYCPRLGYSLTKLIDKNPDGVDDERLEKLLLMPKDEINKWYQNAIIKIRQFLNINK